MNNIIPKHDIPKHEVAVNVTSEGENEARGSTELVAPVFFGPTSDNMIILNKPLIRLIIIITKPLIILMMIL